MQTGTAPQSDGQPRAGQPDHAGSFLPVPGARHMTGELSAEFLGTFVMVLIGVGADAQVLAGGLGSHDSIAWAWGLGVMAGLYTALRISGGHINPAVTIAQALFHGFPWRKVLPYSTAQLAGALAAGLLVRWNYTEIIAKVDPGHTMKTGGIFATLPGNGTAPVSDLGALRDQIIATALLVFLIFALTDTRNSAPLANLMPVAVGLAVVGMAMALGADAGYAINPARDLGPRIAIFLTGTAGPSAISTATCTSGSRSPARFSAASSAPRCTSTACSATFPRPRQTCHLDQPPSTTVLKVRTGRRRPWPRLPAN